MTAFNYDNLNPERREHFVYRCYDEAGHLLYVGCTMDLKRRRSEHSAKYGSRWWPSVARVKLSGPYNYETGRRLEREAIYNESPIWNHNEPRSWRIRVLRNRIYNYAFQTGYARTQDIWRGVAAAEAARAVIPKPPKDRPLNDMDVARAEVAARRFFDDVRRSA